MQLLGPVLPGKSLMVCDHVKWLQIYFKLITSLRKVRKVSTVLPEDRSKENADISDVYRNVESM